MADPSQLSLLGGDEPPERTGPRRIVHVKWAEAVSAVYIGRPGPFGNPFTLPDAKDRVARERVLGLYRDWFAAQIANDAEFRARVEELRGRTLACWCPTRTDPWRSCHGDVILEWLDAAGAA